MFQAQVIYLKYVAPNKIFSHFHNLRFSRLDICIVKFYFGCATLLGYAKENVIDRGVENVRQPYKTLLGYAKEKDLDHSESNKIKISQPISRMHLNGGGF